MGLVHPNGTISYAISFCTQNLLKVNSMEDEDYKFYVTKEKFMESIQDWQKILKNLIKKYTMAKFNARRRYEKNLYEILISENLDSIEYNNKLIIRAEIEKDYLVYWIDQNGTPGMSRMTEEDKKRVYRKQLHMYDLYI